jgi:rhodanese-related sulfurtransferase
MFLSLLLFLAPLASVATHSTEVAPESYQLIDTATLKSWYDCGKEMLLVDARSEGYFDGNILPGAICLPHYTHKEDIAKKLPQKNGTIVIYCGGLDCPASKLLSLRLSAMGYAQVYDYAEGIPAWMAAGYPVERA